MSRSLVAAFVGIMLFTVLGQAVELRGARSRSVTRVELHESRLVPFLQEIRRDAPLTYDSIVLNLHRILDERSRERYRPEERVVAQALLARLTGEDASPGPE